MRYVIRELNYTIVWFYWIFLHIIQEYPCTAENAWNCIKDFYNNCYSKYELTASITLAEIYYKINTELMKEMRHWRYPVRININRFLSELKNENRMPGRYKFD